MAEMIVLDSDVQHRLNDIRAKLNIAKLATQICLSNEDDENINNDLLINQATKYFSCTVLKNLLSEVNTLQTFFDYNTLFKSDPIVDVDNCNDDKNLRDIILQFYFVTKILPDKEAIINKFKTATKKSWKNCQFERFMRIRGYKSKKLPHYPQTIVIEDPEYSLTRIKYLQSVQQFRSSGIPIIYIEEKIVSQEMDFLEDIKQRNGAVSIFYVAVCSSMGMLSYKIVKIPKFSKQQVNYSTLMSWILESVVPYISTGSVFILEDRPHYPKKYEHKPTMYSTKAEMINWLELNDIPHNPDDHSAELFELINKYNGNLLGKNIFHENLTIYGHKALLRPRKTQYLNFFNVIWEKILTEPVKLNIDLFKEMNLKNWIELETTLSEIELRTLNEDIAMNETVEKIFSFAEQKVMPFEFTKTCDYDFDEFKMEETVIINP